MLDMFGVPSSDFAQRARARTHTRTCTHRGDWRQMIGL